MARFVHGKKKRDSLAASILRSAAVFAVTLILFIYAVGQLSESTVSEQKSSLESAINRGILQCYITEGAYPESFEELKEKCNIIYDEELFRVDYRVTGSNLVPEVDVVVLKEED